MSQTVNVIEINAEELGTLIKFSEFTKPYWNRPSFLNKIDDALAASKPIEAIKVVRRESGYGLKIAKRLIDHYRDTGVWDEAVVLAAEVEHQIERANGFLQEVDNAQDQLDSLHNRISNLISIADTLRIERDDMAERLATITTPSTGWVGRLRDLPRTEEGIRVTDYDDDDPIFNGDAFTYYHIDGMYSVCRLDDSDVVHPRNDLVVIVV